MTQRSLWGRYYAFARARKYELLLVALLHHLFVPVLLTDLAFYTRYVWPLNMAVLGLFSVGIYADRGRLHRVLKASMSVVVVVFPVVVVVFPVLPTLLDYGPIVMMLLSICYLIFFTAILVEVLRYLLRPSYINVDLLSAALCGFLLLIETGIFLMQTLYYAVPDGFRGIDTTSFTAIYLDLVYYCCVVVTSIGFGDITPTNHVTRLATSMLGVAAQMYSVGLVGILVSKYSAASIPPQN